MKPLAVINALLFYIFMITASAAPANVTILWNDLERLTYTGGGVGVRMFGDPQNAVQGCGQGSQATSTGSSSVSFNFTGTALQYTFLTDNSGSDAVITLNGTQVDTVCTFQKRAVANSTCNTVTGSIAVGDGMHLVKIVNSPSSTNLNSMYFQSIAYTPSKDIISVLSSGPVSQLGPASSSGPVPSSSPVPSPGLTPSSGSNHPATIGGAIGGGVGLLLIIAAIVYTQTRRRHHVVDLLEGETSSTNNGSREGPSPNQQGRSRRENSASIVPFILPSISNLHSDALLTSHSGSSSPLISRHDNRVQGKAEPPIQMEPTFRLINTSATTGSINANFICEFIQHNARSSDIAIMIRTMATREGTTKQSSSQIGAGRSSLSDTTPPPAYTIRTDWTLV
ncbi:hypothetical protein FRB94_000315 [Tulasnella sp. JGI-2019a]|nr:hypothetical protein FRB93_003196 [Tulasnella sp. JGI-2019a]KAG9006904.1 hypothetical protein FRB94_000315 [Tulasnella sp. JGI-2019a]